MSEFVLRYRGGAVDDGSIEIEDLVSGLQGLAEVCGVIVREGAPEAYKNAALRIRRFRQGSFEGVLAFVEAHPVTVGALTALVVAVIGAAAVYLSKGQLPGGLSDEERAILRALLADKSKARRLRRGFHLIAIPLRNNGGIRSVEVGLAAKPVEVINQDNVGEFAVDDADLAVVHRTIALQGAFRSLDKKTLNGRFLGDDGVAYPVTLIMDNPADCFCFFDAEAVEIRGVAECVKATGKITRIEVEAVERRAG